jgi:hypothetical protein
MGRIVSAVSSKFNTQSQLDDVNLEFFFYFNFFLNFQFKFQTFFKIHQNQGSAARDIRAAIDKIKVNVRWMNACYNQVNDWFMLN